ncbi:hypothetical protein Shewmr4_3217 [Shewanella sp. MR-4]|uniref:hypothetical protein n=1 Tax=Shewanella sp. (strain MR-4) TaxID=60480 RepID=UPI00005E51DC|nr:hypothetical protein [Shewanella sp. MR-4]ABI40285.1 hypothetical protein Shewmr4_3217 [Shewanella sp. MR-4]
MENSKSKVEFKGKQGNPLILSKKMIDRTLLKIHMPTCLNADFSKFSKNSGEDNYANHVLNIISARELSLDEMKLALFLFERYFQEKNATELELFYLPNPESLQQTTPILKYIYAKSPSKSKVHKYPAPTKSLADILKKYNILLENDKNLLEYLRKLHNLGLVTITEVKYPPENEKGMKKNHNNSDEYVFVELNLGVYSAKIHTRWGKPKKEKTVAKHKLSIAEVSLSYIAANKK